MLYTNNRVRLQEQLVRKYNNVCVVVKRGAGLETSVTAALPVIRARLPKYVVITAGICDVRDSKSKTTLRHAALEITITQYKKAMDNVTELLSDLFPNVVVIFAPVTGMDLADYNHPRKKYLVGTELERYLQEKVQHPQQKPLNDIIVELIRVTTEYNQSRGVLTPWTTGSIHKYYNKAYHHNYQHLPDGCHLSETGLKFWAVKIARCIEKMEARRN